MLLYAILYNLVLLVLLGLSLLMPFPEQAMAASAGFLIGAAVGSCLHLVVNRIRHNIPVLGPASFCPRCNTLIARRHNLPIISWFLLWGRCPACRARIPWHYVATEVATAITFAATAVSLI